MSKHDDYLAASHAMQSGVACMMLCDDSEIQPKHLRVGVNSALISNGALVALLIEKGIFTVEEFEDKLLEYTLRDVKSYEDKLSKYYNTEVKLR